MLSLDWILWCSRILWTMTLVVFVLAVYTFARERHWKAAVKVTFTGIFVLVGYGAIMYADFIWQPIILYGIFFLFLLFMFFLMFPIHSQTQMRVLGPQSRIDERDAFFHRFYRLHPNSPNFDAYYATHPDQKAVDDAIRTLPDLGETGSHSYRPIATPMMSAIMSVVNHITRTIDWLPCVEGDVPVTMSPEEASFRLKSFAEYLGADLVGTTRLNPAYIYSHIGRAPGQWGSPISLDHTHAIAIATEMRSDMIGHAPDLPVTVETSDAYFSTAKVAMILAKYLNLLGYEARAHVDGNYRVMCIPIAVDAGLGELGRLGLLITPQFGPRVRLSIVTTNLPLQQDTPISFGVNHFCSICKKCAENCPSGAIDRGEQREIQGVRKWQSKQEPCYRYWRKQGTDCGVCIRVCPYAYPDLPMHNFIRWLVQRNGFARHVAFAGDTMFYGRRPAVHLKRVEWLK